LPAINKEAARFLVNLKGNQFNPAKYRETSGNGAFLQNKKENPFDLPDLDVIQPPKKEVSLCNNIKLEEVVSSCKQKTRLPWDLL